ncbi:hypothetical protein RclHR1_00700012 [Rhizophagus clarus]|uniref:Transmembrane protein n=1 Tax=Rhizophagus clarus TaxID=94130 RepID=A0A2Z6S107_9GLOM|nr:hypothetical protein RclHR1_00700012 [Rhizophagus clarus]GES99819.1 hypothetical protein GLOIN_2v1545114 [Rhizophagus clarus]
MFQKDDKDSIETMKIQSDVTIINRNNSNLETTYNLIEYNDVKNEIKEKEYDVWDNTAAIICVAVGIGTIIIASVATLAMIITDQDFTAVIRSHGLIGTTCLSIGSHLWTKVIKSNKLVSEELEEVEESKFILNKPEQKQMFVLKKPKFALKKQKCVLKRPEKPKFVLKQQKLVQRLKKSSR